MEIWLLQTLLKNKNRTFNCLAGKNTQRLLGILWEYFVEERYGYWQLPGTQQLSLGEVGEDNSKFDFKKNKSINMVKQKVVLEIFRHAESKSGLCVGLILLLHRTLPIFSPNTWQLSMVFRWMLDFRLKLGSQIFWTVRLCRGDF